MMLKRKNEPINEYWINGRWVTQEEFLTESENYTNDQSAKADAGKLELTLVPREIIRDIAAVRMYGAAKYKGPENWRKVSAERYQNAAFRHFLKYEDSLVHICKEIRRLDDPSGVDPKSGLSHLWHLAYSIAFLCEYAKGEKE